MKNKYQRLNKDDKKEIQVLYYNTPKGKSMRLRLTRLVIIGLLGLIVGIYMIGNCIIEDSYKLYDLLVGIPLLLASVVFLVGAFTIRIRVLNQFVLKIPKFKNKRV